MPLFTRQPTANETPDTSGQGGVAVTGAINTGHGSTTANAAFNGSQSKTARWSGFPSAPTGVITSVTLKVGWTQDGAIVDPGSNQFRIQYSIDGGGAWTTLRNVANITSPSSGTASVTLTNNQDLTQVQVRDLLKADGNGDPGGSGSVTASISDIRIEVTTQDPQPIMMM